MRLIDADACIDYIRNNNQHAWEALAYAPTIDAVEVVRCEECKHRYMDGDVTHYYWCRLHDRPVDDADYGAWGEESEADE